MSDLARDLKTLGHPIRLRIIEALTTNRSLVASMISTFIGESRSVTSHHLRILEQGGFVEGWKSGQYVVYVRNRSKILKVLKNITFLTDIEGEKNADA